MITSVPLHALPLIPPSDNTMTMAQCDAEIADLTQIHHKAIIDFWNGLKSGSSVPGQEWDRVRFDLHKLFLSQNKFGCTAEFDSPETDYVKQIWTNAISELDEEIQSEIQMTPYASLKLVAVITDDKEVTLVHRYEGDEVYNVSEESLGVNDDSGPNWYYRSYFYEPTGFDRGTYQVPCLYVIGSIDAETSEWLPKTVSSSELFELESMVDAMESLLELDKVREGRGVQLPAFKSGVEAKLYELQLLRNWMVKQGFTATIKERDAIASAAAVFDGPIQQLRSQIKALEEELRTQEKLQGRAKMNALLKTLGFEVGQMVKHASSGEIGILSFTDERQPDVFVHIEGKERPRWGSSHQAEYELRRGEWSLVDGQNVLAVSVEVPA